MRKSNDLSEALKKSVAHLAFELKRDPDYRRSWSANIAMAFKDAYAREARVVNGGLVDMHTVANQAAEDFLELLCMDRAYVSIQDLNTPHLNSKLQDGSEDARSRQVVAEPPQGDNVGKGTEKLPEAAGMVGLKTDERQSLPTPTTTSKVLCARCVREVSAELDEIIGESTQTVEQSAAAEQALYEYTAGGTTYEEEHFRQGFKAGREWQAKQDAPTAEQPRLEEGLATAVLYLRNLGHPTEACEIETFLSEKAPAATYERHIENVEKARQLSEYLSAPAPAVSELEWSPEQIVALIGNIGNRPDIRQVQETQVRLIKEALAKVFRPVSTEMGPSNAEAVCDALNKYKARIRELEALLPKLNHKLDKAYLYTPAGHESDWYALSWDGTTRIAERMVKPWADDLLGVVEFYLKARALLSSDVGEGDKP